MGMGSVMRGIVTVKKINGEELYVISQYVLGSVLAMANVSAMVVVSVIMDGLEKTVEKHNAQIIAMSMGFVSTINANVLLDGKDQGALSQLVGI